MVSPQHRVVLDTPAHPRGAFAPAGLLAAEGDGRFRHARGIRQVTYYNLLLPRHAVMFANGAQVESFYPGPRALHTLSLPDLARLHHVIPDLSTVRDGSEVCAVYGPLARLQLRRRDLRLMRRHMAPVCAMA